MASSSACSLALAHDLGEILVELERARDRARDLGHLEAVAEPRAVVIALVKDEDLRLVFEAAEGRRVDDAVAIALIGRARRALRLLDEAAAALGRIARVRCQESSAHGATLQVPPAAGNALPPSWA